MQHKDVHIQAEISAPVVVVGGTEEVLAMVDGEGVEGTAVVLCPRLSWASGHPSCSDWPRKTPNATVDGIGGSEVEDVLGAVISVK